MDDGFSPIWVVVSRTTKINPMHGHACGMGERDARPLEAFDRATTTEETVRSESSTKGNDLRRDTDSAQGQGNGPGRSQTLGASEHVPPRSDPRKVEAILFDLDNTLVDFLRVKRLASAACARAMVAAGADFGESTDDVAEMIFRHYLDHGIESDDAFSVFLRRYQRNKFHYGQNQMDKVLAAGINAYLRTKETLLAPYPGVPSTLVALIRRGYRLGVVTDAPRLKAWQRLWAVGLADLFEVVVTRTDAGGEKPHGKGFLAAIDALGIPAHRTAMVGDWPARDIVGGNRLGLFTVLAHYGRDGHEDLGPHPPVADVQDGDTDTPDLEIHAFPELLRVFTGTPAAKTAP
jgi:HAD superfamily hydrolase (TIGR01509 family)